MYIQLDNKFYWFGLPYGLVYSCGGACLNMVEQNKETCEKRDEYFVEEGVSWLG